VHSLTPLQKLFEKPLATFRVELVSTWESASNKYEMLALETMAAGAGAAAGNSDGPVELDLKFN
jgi:hypothetical protein